ncbi:MAG TPA: proton-conducting transporter membrane subunit [Jatrophihabitantaceae bacterium]|nr:proton-conducting transporter membrane subunit [Jatrophihabitantaceae bacterium]
MSAAATLLPLAVVIPIGGAVISPLIAKLHRKLPLIVGMIAMTGSVLVLVPVAGQVYSGSGHVVVHFFSAEHPIHGKLLGIAFAADPFGMMFALLAAGLGGLLLLSLLSEFGGLGEREIGSLACLVQLLLAALIAAALTADTVNLFVWFEVAALSSYGLTGFFLERPIALEAAFKILVLTSIAGFAVFVGAGLLYSKEGALSFAQLHNSLLGGDSRVALVALALLIAGFGTKAGIAPFHGWLPDAHTPVPGGISALFSGLMVDLGIVAIARLTLQVYGADSGHALLGLITGLGITSALLGAIMALAQDDLKRLLAWDTVSQMGLLLTGFGSATEEGVGGAAFQLVSHGLFKALLFLCAGSIVHSTGLTKLSEIGGLARRRPVVTAAFTVGALSISGVPGFSGYASLSLIHEGLLDEPVIHALALVAQVITVAALARATWLGFYRRREEEYEQLERTPIGMRIALFVVGSACIVFGIFPSQFVERVVGPAASILLDPSGYSHAVLAGSGTVPASSLVFDYGKASDLITTAIEIGIGLLVAAVYLRIREPRPVTWLRRLHTGSVNDYAAYLAGGIALAAGILLGG